MEAPNTKVALTLFTLRHHCTTPEAFDRTIRRLRDIGYRAVQISAVPLPRR